MNEILQNILIFANDLRLSLRFRRNAARSNSKKQEHEVIEVSSLTARGTLPKVGPIIGVKS